MSKRTPALDHYAEQIARLTRALTSLQEDAARELPVDDYSREQILLFAEENVDKRRDLLQMEVSFLASAFDDLDELLDNYASATPQEAYNTTTGDAERFLNWLEQEADLTAEQEDHVACLRARLGVQHLARQRRGDHLHFQDLWSVAGLLAADLSRGANLKLHLNPLRVWTRFHTRTLLDETADVPADVLFFAVGADIHTALLDYEGQALLEELSSLAPCQFRAWVARSELAEAARLRTFCVALANLGLLAFS